MTKTIKELLDERSAELVDLGYAPLYYPVNEETLKDFISEVEALVRRETVEEILELAYDVNMDDRMASPLYAVTGEEIKDYAKTKNITL